MSVRVQELMRDTIFPVQRIDKEGRDAPDFSSGELREHHAATPPTLPFRISRWLLGTWLQSGEFSETAYTDDHADRVACAQQDSQDM